MGFNSEFKGLIYSGLQNFYALCRDGRIFVGLSIKSSESYSNCPLIVSWWGARFFAPVQTGPGAHPATYKMGTGSFLRVKRPGRDVDHPHTSSFQVKERVELYLYSPLSLHGLF